MKTISIFPTHSPEGRQLGEAVYALAKRLGYRAVLRPGASWDDYLTACFEDDAVVADCTIEDGHNYGIFNALHLVFDRIYMVGRTYVPLNMVPVRKGGFPPYPYPLPDYFAPAQTPRSGWTNDDIVAWLEGQWISALPHNTEKFSIKDLVEDENARKRYAEYMKTLRDEALSRNRAEAQIFISYRSKYYDAARTLAQRIEKGDFHGGTRKKVRLLAPGSLSYEKELLTPMRRWQLMSLLDRYLGDCEELWVYGSQDYFNSWWTQGELVTIGWRKATNADGFPSVKYFDIRTQTATPADHLVPAFTEAQNKRMARWYSKCDPLGMSPESAVFWRAFRKLSRIPVIGTFAKWQFRRKAKSDLMKQYGAMMAEFNPFKDDQFDGDTLPDLLSDKQFLENYLKDDVWSDEFWEHPVLELGLSSAPGSSMDVESFLSMKSLNYDSFSPAQIRNALRRGILETKAGKRRVVEATPRYLWHTTRAGRPTTQSLQPLETILAYQEENTIPATR